MTPECETRAAFMPLSDGRVEAAFHGDTLAIRSRRAALWLARESPNPTRARIPMSSVSLATPASLALRASLLAFVAGFVDTVGFVSLSGLFTAHVTGNLVLIGASLTGHSAGLLTKLLALPVFVVVVATVTAVARARAVEGGPAQRPLLWVQAVMLAATLAAALALQPLGEPDSARSMTVGLMAVAAMAIQNAGAKLAFSQLTPTTVMTGNVTQLVMDSVDVAMGHDAAARDRIRRFLPSVLAFAVGAIGGALLYAWIGFAALALPVLALLMAMRDGASRAPQATG
jgi:uncharacterized membrane protein YoaK (UPF0700 family)